MTKKIETKRSRGRPVGSLKHLDLNGKPIDIKKYRKLLAWAKREGVAKDLIKQDRAIRQSADSKRINFSNGDELLEILLEERGLVALKKTDWEAIEQEERETQEAVDRQLAQPQEQRYFEYFNCGHCGTRNIIQEVTS